MAHLVETTVRFSKFFKAGTANVPCGRYDIRLVPSVRPRCSQGVLSFSNDYASPEGGGSHPEEEANLACNCLAVLLGAQVKREALRINAVEIALGGNEGADPFVGGEADSSSVFSDLARVMTLQTDLARQFARSCRAYASALDFIPSDPTFAFFLLVVSIECMSSQAAIIAADDLDVDSGKCERFCMFVDRYLQSEARGDDERNADLFRSLLKEVYYAHRSGFVHGGREVSSASLMADRVGSSYFKHATSGKEVRTPGLRWFARIVRSALLGYVRSLPDAPGDPQLFAKLANEKAVLKIQAAKDLAAGQVATFDDINYR